MSQDTLSSGEERGDNLLRVFKISWLLRNHQDTLRTKVSPTHLIHTELTTCTHLIRYWEEIIRDSVQELGKNTNRRGGKFGLVVGIWLSELDAEIMTTTSRMILIYELVYLTELLANEREETILFRWFLASLYFILIPIYLLLTTQ
jgi:hypothetical protein